MYPIVSSRVIGIRLKAIGPTHADLFKKTEALTSSDEIIDESDRTCGDRRREGSLRGRNDLYGTYSRDIWIEDIATAVSLSSRYLNSLFNEEKGISVHKALTEIRIRHARRLLSEEPHMSVGDIASSVGYQTPHSFMRMFKRHEGVTPGSFRRNIARYGATEGRT